MNKIRLTEAQLHRVIKESVEKVLNEISSIKESEEDDDYHGGKVHWDRDKTMTQQLRDERGAIREKDRRANAKESEWQNKKLIKTFEVLDRNGYTLTEEQKALFVKILKKRYMGAFKDSKPGRFTPRYAYEILKEMGFENV